MVRAPKSLRAPVGQDLAQQHALLTIRRNWAAQVDGFGSWATAKVAPNPVTICDLDGDPLFYEFTVMEGNEEVGRVKAAATKWVGAPVPTVEFGPRPWSPEKGIKMAKSAAQVLYPQGRIEKTELVCYSYPKIGIRVDVKLQKKELSQISDVASGKEEEQYGAEELEGQTAWSFLERIPPWEGETRTKLWDLRDLERDAVLKATPQAFESDLSRAEADKLLPTLRVPSKVVIAPAIASRVLQYGPRCTTHDCFALYSQQTDVYCAVATGQMILDFYRWNFDQTAIAAAMGTGSSGSTQPGQIAGYQSLSKNGLIATLDTSPTWASAKGEIDANRPLKSG